MLLNPSVKLTSKSLIVNQWNLEGLMVLPSRVCQVAWRFGRAPKDGKLIIPIRNKGDRSECTNYRSISLLILPGRVYAKFVKKG